MKNIREFINKRVVISVLLSLFLAWGIFAVGRLIIDVNTHGLPAQFLSDIGIKCPDDYESINDKNTLFNEWTDDFYAKNPSASYADLDMARREFYVKNKCLEAIKRFDEYVSSSSGTYIDAKSLKSVDNSDYQFSSSKCDNYKDIHIFSELIPVVWKAKLNSCIMYNNSDCNGASFTRLPEEANYKYPNFAGYYIYPEEQYLHVIPAEYFGVGTTLQISGEWSGIDTSDDLSVFKNKCVPSIMIRNIEIASSTPWPNYSTQFSSLRYWTAKIGVENRNYPMAEYTDIEYPQFIGRDEVIGLNESIRSIVLDKIAKDIRVEAPAGVQLSSTYRVVSIVNDIVSIELIFNDGSGGIVGDTNTSIAINYDMKKNRLLKTEELFCGGDYSSKLSSLAFESIYDQFNKNDSGISTDSTNSIIKMTSPGPINFENILLGYRGLSVIYPPNTLTYRTGYPSTIYATIPYSAIRDTICLP